MPRNTPGTTTRSRSSRRVHPRAVWGGLALALAGCLTLGVGIVVLSWSLSLIGAALMALGVVVGVLGGALHDARPEFSVGDELRELKHGDVHRGVAPGEMVDDPRVRADALRTSARVHALLGETPPRSGGGRRSGRRALARPSGAVLVLVTIGMYVLAGSLVTPTPIGHAVALRDMGLSIAIAIAGLRLLSGSGPHRVVATVALLAGAGLALLGVLGAHGDPALAPIETVAGLLAMTAALVAWVSPAAPEAEPSEQTEHPAPHQEVQHHESPSSLRPGRRRRHRSVEGHA